MKPTIEQVVSHFNLPPEALGSVEIKIAIAGCACGRPTRHDFAMSMIANSFELCWDCSITDYFKPNDGLEDSRSNRDEHSLDREGG